MKRLRYKNIFYHIVGSQSAQNGSMLVYIIVVMTIFGILGISMVSMFSSSTMMTSGVPNYTRRALYLAESGMRHAYNELRNELAQEHFGKDYKKLNKDYKKAIKQIYPNHVSEAEPRDIRPESLTMQ